jgi:hypothetical protein
MKQYIIGNNMITKIINMFKKKQDKRKIYRSLSNYFPDRYVEKTIGLYQIFSYLKNKNIKGDIVECGVGRGVSIFKMAKISTILEMNKNIFGYDSFEGFPEPNIKDDSFRNPKKGDWSDTSIKHVEEHFLESQILKDFFTKNVFLVQGFFDKTLPISSHKDIAFLHLDCDLYDSYRTCLKELFKKVSKGGIVLIDEYKHAKWPGATKAIDEFGQTIDLNIVYSKLLDRYLIVDFDENLYKSLQIEK